MNDIYVAPARAGTRPPQRGGANRSSRPRSPLQARAALLGGGALLALLCIYDLRCRSRRCDKGSLTKFLAKNSSKTFTTYPLLFDGLRRKTVID